MVTVPTQTTTDGIGAKTLINRQDIHRSKLLSDQGWLVHGITRRVPGAGVADGNVGYSAPRDRNDAWNMRRQWMIAAGLNAAQIAVAYQTHGNEVRVVNCDDAGRGADPESRSVGHADALIVSEAGVVALTLHADCMPIILCDPVRRIAATIHAGWRGTVADVSGATVETMTTCFGVSPLDIVAYLGPAIGGCCYEVGSDVADAWVTAVETIGHSALSVFGQRWRFDLQVANRHLLRRAGVRDDHIEQSDLCTKCNCGEWFSHRGQGAETGRYGSFISIVV
jgi:YfiH family protein